MGIVRGGGRGGGGVGGEKEGGEGGEEAGGVSQLDLLGWRHKKTAELESARAACRILQNKVWHQSSY